MRRETLIKVILLILFSALCFLILVPFYAVTIASFKPGEDLIRYGLNLKFDLSVMNLDNFTYLFTGNHSYFMWFFNSLLLTVVQVTLTLLVSATVAYGFAAYDFIGKNFLFICVLLIMMVPFEILLLPLYSLTYNLGLMNSYSAIVLPGIASAATIFFFRQYLRGIPKEMIAAGRVDGATEYGIYVRLILPVMKPSFAAMAILNGMNSWNNFLWPFMVLSDDSKYTLPIGLKTLLTPYGNNYDLLIVGSFFSIIPIFILFMGFQKYFIDGMTAGAVKG
ncbi:carbohydrate ABC transporter permease [Paenibacillus glucanolyticus]|jgi:arabinosaccharide transport system permease protein|uniref:Arabinose transporter permease n=1 Tax=Paenibacillus glucanolyticus TaxID=59843 RepID=A0A163KW09_9BACL|nr:MULTISPECIES: carbohydrate ABC transporter permease [Paenibacillus]ANA81524.1 arabinose transporter permease [Paenibacillus glucanolyticus]AVV59744.1 carbohydrate ABC transporter permease [Paenibacillus glucanolyticus]ETT33470.1 binding-protein-dependent transport systems inner membrane component [Paenibacillus sp. FSL R5-808]KZS47572.1 arabinose transporter permease [Paenibacillus glucanolyticus]MDH6674050.1 arabinosaccharide transport system permease protein [Paenibacillus sp. LBL]